MEKSLKFTNIFKPINLSKGKIWKVILAFMIPIFLSSFFQQIYSLTDAAIVGQTLSNAEIAGVNDTGNLVFLVLQFAFGCSAGFSVVTAKWIGAKNIALARKSFLTQIILCFIISGILTLIAILCIDPMLGWLGISSSEFDINKQAVYNAAYGYLFIIFLGIIAQMFYNLIVSVLRSFGDSFSPLLFLIFSTLLNIGLDFLFIVTFKMGVRGAAVATVIAQGIAAIGCFVYTYIRYKELRFKKEDFKIDMPFVIEHLRLGLPLAFQFSILAIGLVIMQGSLIQFDIGPNNIWIDGSPAQLGYGAACKVVNFLMSPLNALGTAMLSFAGQNLGAKEYKRIKNGFIQAVILSLVIWIIVMMFGLCLTINGAYQYIFLSADKINSTTIHYGNTYLYTVLPLFPFLGVLFISRNMIQGIEKPLFPFLAGIGELVARVVICLYLPALINGAAINSLASTGSFIGLSLADPFAWMLGAVALIYPVYKYIIKQDYQIDKKIEA